MAFSLLGVFNCLLDLARLHKLELKSALACMGASSIKVVACILVAVDLEFSPTLWTIAGEEVENSSAHVVMILSTAFLTYLGHHSG